MRQPPFQMPRTGHSKQLRYLMAAAAWLCLMAQVSALTHFLLVEHVRCSEHGELVHAHGRHNDGDGISLLAVPPTDEQMTPSGDPDEHEHEHCLVSLETYEALDEASPLHTLKSVSLPIALLPQASSEIVLVARVYAFAPKTSPPA